MQATMNVTEVRANFSEFIDRVVREKPQVVKRNRDVVTTLSLPHVNEILKFYEFSMEYEETDGEFVGSIEQIEDIVGSGKSLEELKLNLAHQLIEYAEDYYADFSSYYNAPNRKAHFPYVFRILIQNDVKSVSELIHA